MPAGIRPALVLLATMVACGGGGTEPADPDAAPTPDAPTPDAGTDAPTPDAATDAPAPDAATDAATDAGTDAAPDASPDAAVEQLPALGAGLGTLSGAATSGNVDGARGIARFSNPVNVVSDGAGGVVVCDFDNGTLRRVDATGAVTSPFTLPATFSRPFGIARDGDTLYVQTDRSTTNTPTGALYRVSLSTGTGTLVRDDFGRYRGLAVLSDGRLVGANYQQHVVSIIDPATGAATVLAGTAGMSGNTDATGADARFHLPYDLVVLPGDEIVVADFGNGALRKITLAGVVTTLVATGTSFTNPQGLARAVGGTIYVSDPGARVIKAVGTDSSVTTVAGNGTPGWLDAADPLTGQLFAIEGLDLSSDGMYLYVADGSGGEAEPHHRVRRLTLAP